MYFVMLSSQDYFSDMGNAACMRIGSDSDSRMDSSMDLGIEVMIGSGEGGGVGGAQRVSRAAYGYAAHVGACQH